MLLLLCRPPAPMIGEKPECATSRPLETEPAAAVLNLGPHV